MKTLNINDKTFQFKSDVFKFLHDYLERINAFVSKNQIDAELYQDILQIFEEKLSACADTAAMNQKEAIQIVNALGEPEEIFAESLEYAKKEEKTGSDLVLTYFYERLQHEEWSRPQQKAFFL